MVTESENEIRARAFIVNACENAPSLHDTTKTTELHDLVMNRLPDMLISSGFSSADAETIVQTQNKYYRSHPLEVVDIVADEIQHVVDLEKQLSGATCPLPEWPIHGASWQENGHQPLEVLDAHIDGYTNGVTIPKNGVRIEVPITI